MFGDMRFHVEAGEFDGQPAIELELEDALGLAFWGMLSLGDAHTLIGALMVAVANARRQLGAGR